MMVCLQSFMYLFCLVLKVNKINIGNDVLCLFFRPRDLVITPKKVLCLTKLSSSQIGVGCSYFKKSFQRTSVCFNYVFGPDNVVTAVIGF